MTSLQLPLPNMVPSSDWRPEPLSALPQSWKDVKRLGFDIETRDDHLKELGPGVRRGSYIVGYSFAIEDGPSYYVPFRHEGGDNLDPDQAVQYLRDRAGEFTGELVGANLSYELDFCSEIGVEWTGATCRDVQVADPLIWEHHRSYSLAAILERWSLPPKDEALLRQAADVYEVCPKGGLWRLPARYVGAYGAADAALPLSLLRKQEREIEAQDLWGVYDLESKLLPVLVRMRRRGIRVDMDRLRFMEEWSLNVQRDACAEITARTGVNVAIGDLMKASALAPAFEAIGIALAKTKTGKPSITAAMLDSLDHPVGAAIRRGRQMDKLRNTYCNQVRKFEINGRVHPSFNQLRRRKEEGSAEAGTITGRCSADDPSIQNQPTRDDEFGMPWRGIYVADAGSLGFASCDYCFDDQTEILTEHGFVKFPELDPTAKVAQWHKDRTIDYVVPSEHQIFDYRGPMVSVSGRFVDLLMTPNHTCVFVDRDGTLIKSKARDYSEWKRRHWAIPTGGVVTSGRKEDPDVLRLVVAVQADASDRVSSYRFWLKREDKIQRVKYLLTRLGVPYTTGVCEKKGGQTYISFSRDLRVLQYLDDGKTFILDQLLGLDFECRSVFLDELHFWDGNRKQNKYFSTNLHNCDVVNHLATITDRRSTLATHQWQPNHKTLGSVSLSYRKTASIQKLQIETKQYLGKVYCVTVPTHMIIIRRCGKVSISGQSQQEPRWTVHWSEECNLNGATEAGDQYRNDPTTDHHSMMADLTGLKRKDAKAVFLGLCYGMGGAKLCRGLGLPTKTAERRGRMIEVAGDEGQSILDKFSAAVPFVRDIAKLAERRASRVGYVRTHSGRRCRFIRDAMGNYDWTYKALNKLIQGSSADQTKEAMVAADAAGFPLQLQIHDELDLSIESIEQANELATLMQDVIPLRVPSKVDVEVGPSWGEISEEGVAKCAAFYSS